jgi:hypothetical protein
MMPAARVLQNLSKHEYRLNRQAIQLLREYYAMRDRREGNDTPTARVLVDVEGLPELD